MYQQFSQKSFASSLALNSLVSQNRRQENQTRPTTEIFIKNSQLNEIPAINLPSTYSQRLISEYFNNNEVKNLTSDLETMTNTSVKSSQYNTVVGNIPSLFTCGVDITGKIKSIYEQPSAGSSQITSKENNLKHKIQSNQKIITQQKTIKSDVEADKQAKKIIHLIGYVENVLRWNLILKNEETSVLYNVLGVFVNAMDGIHAMEKYVFIRGNNGIILECSFFDVDRSLPVIKKGQFVGCFGQIIAVQKLRMYSIDVLDETEYNEAQRAIFLSQRTAHELSNRSST